MHAELALAADRSVVARAGGWTSALGPVLEPYRRRRCYHSRPSSPVEASSRLDGRGAHPAAAMSEVEGRWSRAGAWRTSRGNPRRCARSAASARHLPRRPHPQPAGAAGEACTAAARNGERARARRPRRHHPELQDRFGQSGWCTCSRSRVSRRPDHGAGCTSLPGSSGSAERRRSRAAGWAPLYVAFLGWPPRGPAAALALARRPQPHRPAAGPPDALLAATCLASCCSTLGHPRSRRVALRRRALGCLAIHPLERPRASPDFWCRTGASSLGATLATAPLTAGSLGRSRRSASDSTSSPSRSPRSPCRRARQPAAVPVWHGAAEGLAQRCGLCLHLLELCGRRGRGSRRPRVTDPGLSAAAPWSLRSPGPLGHRHRNTALVAAPGGLAVTSGSGRTLPILPWSGDEGNDLALHFLDVGQGDGRRGAHARGRWVVIDVGPASQRSDAGARWWSRSWSGTARGPSRRWSSPTPTSTTSAASRRCSTDFPWARCSSRARRSVDPLYTGSLRLDRATSRGTRSTG
jgi:hypothetical protein